MKKPKTTTQKQEPKTKAKPVAATEGSQVKSTKSNRIQKAPTKSQTEIPSKPVEKAPEIPTSERVGLTAGSIWHYLAENGSTPVAKLVREITEEEKIIQRSIGWLAQEGKITLETIGRIETIGLKN